MTYRVRMAAAAWLCAAAVWAADWKQLRPQGYLSDYAGVVDSSSRRQLDAYCAALEKSTGARLFLVIIPSLRREPSAAVARAIFEAWTTPPNTPDNSVLLLVSIGDRRDKIVAGRALNGPLNADAIDDVLSEARPELARKRYGQGLMAAAGEIGSRIAASRHATIPVHLPRRPRRTFIDYLPWPLLAGSVVIIGVLVWLLRHPHYRRPPREPA